MATSHRESDDGYDKVIARLGPEYRLIECKDGIQWILQRKRGHWRSEKFLTSREGVLRRVQGLPGWEVLKNLPTRFQTRFLWQSPAF